MKKKKWAVRISEDSVSEPFAVPGTTVSIDRYGELVRVFPDRRRASLSGSLERYALSLKGLGKEELASMFGRNIGELTGMGLTVKGICGITGMSQNTVCAVMSKRRGETPSARDVARLVWLRKRMELLASECFDILSDGPMTGVVNRNRELSRKRKLNRTSK